MPCGRKSAKHILSYAILLSVFSTPTPQVFGSPGTAHMTENGDRAATVLSVRKVLRNQYFVSRYPQIHYYILYISLNISDRTQCTEYETPVLDEIEDISSAIGQNVNAKLKGKSIILRAPKGHKLKTQVVNRNQC